MAGVGEIVICLSKRLDGTWPMLYVGATGVGTPFYDMLRDARIGAAIRPCCCTHGDRRTEVDGEIRLGKAWLVTGLQVLLQGGRLRLPRTSEADALARELLDY